VVVSSPKPRRAVWLLVAMALSLAITSSHPALAQLRTPGELPILITQLHDESPAVRRAALQDLHRLGREAKDAGPEVAKLLKDPDKGVRRDALRFIETALRGEAKDTVPVLVELLKDPEKGVRSTAINALNQIGGEAKDAAPELLKLLKDPDRFVQGSTKDCHRRLGSRQSRGEGRGPRTGGAAE
jgi:HEAT repeat protein